MYIHIIPYQFVVISSHLMYLMCCQEDGLVVPSLACLEVALLESLRLGIRSAGNTGMLHWRCNVPGMIPPKKMWKFVTCDEMWYHNVWLHLTAFQGTYWQRAWWRRKYAFGQCLKFYTECQCLLLNSFSSDLTSTGSAPSKSVLLSLRLIRLVFISLVQFPSHPFGAWVFVFLSTLACSRWALDGWNRMEPVALQEPRWRAGSHVLHPQGALGRGSSEVHPSASCPLVHWSQLNYHQVDLREWNREATRHSIMSPEDLGWIQKQCTFIILAYILHPLDILSWLIMHHDPWHQCDGPTGKTSRCAKSIGRPLSTVYTEYTVCKRSWHKFINANLIMLLLGSTYQAPVRIPLQNNGETLPCELESHRIIELIWTDNTK